ERRRATAALAGAPLRAGLDDGELGALLDDPDAWLVAAVGVAAPYLVRERAALAATLLPVLIARPGVATAWSVTEGLIAARRGGPDELAAFIDPLLATARARALDEAARSAVDAQLWQAVRRATDFLDGLEADAAYPDELLDRVVRDAARVGARALATRAGAIARGLRAGFDARLPAATGSGGMIEDRGHALAAVESCTRAAALALWEPVLIAAGRAPIALDDTRAHMAEVLGGYLEQHELDFALRRTALRGLGNLADAGEGPSERGRAAAFALAAVAGSRWAASAPSPSARKRFRKPVTDLFWRLGDALGHGQAPVGQVAAWWSLCAGAPELLELLEPDEDAARIAGAVQAIQRAPAAAAVGASVMTWGPMIERALDELGAGDTALAAAARMLFGGLADAELALRGRVQDDLAFALGLLVEPIAWLGELGRDPRAALASSRPLIAPGPDAALLEQATRAIDTGAPGPDEVAASWAARVGPALRPAVEQLVRNLVRERRRAVAVSARDDRVGPYHKLRRLGSGGHADVWLARRDGARRFVLKIPRRELSATARRELGLMLEREAKLLEGLHEAKVASFIDHGWAGDTPYLVLEYLVGVDLFHYASVELLGLRELGPIVRDVCLGLRALHGRGIVHRDLKPSNVFLRLQLPPDAGEEFRAAHRDPSAAPVSDAVLIDFGVAWRMSVDAAREHAEGTLGYLSPEQAEAADEITGKSDIYGLAGTIFTALTGHRFFEDRATQPAYLVAHALERPFADTMVCKAAAHLPDPLIELLDQATSLDPTNRPDVDTFAHRFATIVSRFSS
ncbi:MAG TPA: serine/threonine-protein kinase, partial [Kofleriaceae bacterium]|nr:serine/threonine-protein kinase [Kofleriaceae bacterium]